MYIDACVVHTCVYMYFYVQMCDHVYTYMCMHTCTFLPGIKHLLKHSIFMCILASFFPSLLMAWRTRSPSDSDRMIICKSTQNSHMYKWCLVILRHFVETTQVVGTGQWCINCINHCHHSSKGKTKRLQHTQSSRSRREWSCIKPRLGPTSLAEDVKNMLPGMTCPTVTHSEIPIYKYHREDLGFTCLSGFFCLFVFFLMNRRCNCFIGPWKALEPDFQAYEQRNFSDGKSQNDTDIKCRRHEVQKDSFLFLSSGSSRKTWDCLSLTQIQTWTEDQFQGFWLFVLFP